MIKKIAVAGLILAGFVVSVVGLSKTITEIKNEEDNKKPEVVLASAGISEESGISLSVNYYDQRADECVNLYDLDLRDKLNSRQFEWTKCEYERDEVEQGLVEEKLGTDGLPVMKRGNMIPNHGLENSTRWFSAVEGKSKNYVRALKMEYDESQARFSYENDEFYPLDEYSFSNGDFTNSDGHNHLFTMDFSIPFVARLNGREEFSISADDDTFVFLGADLIIDMGGVHGETNGTLKIDTEGKVFARSINEEYSDTGIRLAENDLMTIRVFHADRDSKDSVFRMSFAGMNINIVNTKLADNEGKELAYETDDPLFIAPLGVSSEVRPELTREYAMIATIQAVSATVLAIFMVIITRILVKQFIR